MKSFKTSLFFLFFLFPTATFAQVFHVSDTGVRFESENDSSDVEKINFLGKKNSLKYVAAILEEGKKIKVPIVNNLVPTLELHIFEDGSYLRIYHYDRRSQYSGESLLKFKTINRRSEFFDLSPSLQSEKTSFQEPVPATGLIVSPN